MFHRICCLAVVLTAWVINQTKGADHVQFIQPQLTQGSSAAVVVRGLPLAQTTQLDASNDEGKLVGEGNAAEQAVQVLKNLDRVLKRADSNLSETVKLNVYLARDELLEPVRQTLAQTFTGERQPAVTYVMTALPTSGALVAMDATGTVRQPATKDRDELLRRGNVQTNRVYPDRKSPIRAGDPRVTVLPHGQKIYISGQAEKAETLAEATRRTLASLESSLKFCGADKSHVTQVKCFLSPMSQVQEVDREIEHFFGSVPVPAVSHVEWVSTLPIEIEVVAYGGPAINPAPATKIEFLTPPGMTSSPVFSRIARIRHHSTIFIGGLYGEAGANGTQQVEQIFKQLGSVLHATRSDFTHLAKATYYVSQDEPSQKLNELRPRFYAPDSPPAASKAQVLGVGRAGSGLTLDMIAIPTAE